MQQGQSSEGRAARAEQRGTEQQHNGHGAAQCLPPGLSAPLPPPPSSNCSTYASSSSHEICRVQVRGSGIWHHPAAGVCCKQQNHVGACN